MLRLFHITLVHEGRLPWNTKWGSPSKKKAYTEPGRFLTDGVAQNTILLPSTLTLFELQDFTYFPATY